MGRVTPMRCILVIGCWLLVWRITPPLTPNRQTALRLMLRGGNLVIGGGVKLSLLGRSYSGNTQHSHCWNGSSILPRSTIEN